MENQKLDTIQIICLPTKEQKEMIHRYRDTNCLVWNMVLEYYDAQFKDLRNLVTQKKLDEFRKDFTAYIVSKKTTETSDPNYVRIAELSPNQLYFIIVRAIKAIYEKGRENVDKFDDNRKINFIHFPGEGINKSDRYHVYIPDIGNLMVVNNGKTYGPFWKIVNNIYDIESNKGIYIVDKANIFIFKTNAYALSLYYREKKY